ncbi:protein NYNRIN-like [Prunus dulcis]|uniref:protein NYNRIN-like n=1 Tax=Prunus dulcis TaxID=3755 RepID=UPI001482EBB6|nr:protein NYNRIN-like [Prunus dulcis]
MDFTEVMVLTVTPDNWRHEIVSYLKDPNGPHSQQVLRRARYYVIKDKILFRIGSNDLLMKCLAKKEQRIAMTEVHEGICGAHQASIKMRWLLRRHGYFWPTILKDCIEYAKGFQDCQRHGLVPHVPTEPMNPIVKAWPFKGWATDVIGQIPPELSKGHKYILVAIDFFKKWVEAVPLKKVTQVEVLEFIEKIIIHRFGLPESIMTDRGTAFMGKAVQATARNWGVRMVQSTPYNPQSSGQAEASNKDLKKVCYRNDTTLTYGHDAVLPLEIFVRSLRVARHGEWSKYVYNQAMAQELDDLEEVRLDALDKLKAQKETVSRAYDKKTKAKSFEVRDLVWKTILPTRSKDPKFGKWSPTWEGPFLIHQILRKIAYKLSTEMGESMMHQSMADF